MTQPDLHPPVHRLLAKAFEPGLGAAARRAAARKLFTLTVIHACSPKDGKRCGHRVAWTERLRASLSKNHSGLILSGFRDRIPTNVLVAFAMAGVGEEHWIEIDNLYEEAAKASGFSSSTVQQALEHLLNSAEAHGTNVPNYAPHTKTVIERLSTACAMFVAAHPAPAEEPTTTNEDTSHMTTAAPTVPTVAVIPEAIKTILNTTLGAAGLPPIEKLVETQTLSAVQAAALAKQEEEIAKLRVALAEAETAAPREVEASADGTIPKGALAKKSIKDVFDIPASSGLDFDVPVFEWDGKHPHVPEIDPAYVIRPDHLVQVLWALTENVKTWVYGHTGTGKSTLIEQVCARLGWPMLRVNFDSEITRLDLIGREVLTTDGDGKTVSQFVEGILPTSMQGPYVLLCDEVDFMRPDVAYVFQRALEDKGLLLTEDGGRLVKPHPLFRIIATANTCGQGDEHGLYQGARPQSMAYLDRFSCFIKVDYLSPADEKAVLKARIPGIKADILTKAVNYAVEHRKAFASGQIAQPLSPRGLAAFLKAVVRFSSMVPEAKAIQMARDAVITNRANSQDKVVIEGLINRVFA